MNEPVTSLAHYRVKEGCVDEFLDIIDRHWVTLRDLELVTDRPAEVFIGDEKAAPGPLVVELFEWTDGDAAARAHTHPRVSMLWESMGPLTEPRGDRGPFEFASLQRRPAAG
jgi:hypothetical protein